MYATGVNSQEFMGFGKNEKLEVEKIVSLSPEGAVNLPVGKYKLSLKVFKKQGRDVKQVYLSFKNPKLEIPIDLIGLEREKWIKLEQVFNKPSASHPNDRFKIEVRQEDIPKIKAAKFFIDDIAINKVD